MVCVWGVCGGGVWWCDSSGGGSWLQNNITLKNWKKNAFCFSFFFLFVCFQIYQCGIDIADCIRILYHEYQPFEFIASKLASADDGSGTTSTKDAEVESKSDADDDGNNVNDDGYDGDYEPETGAVAGRDGSAESSADGSESCAPDDDMST